MHTTSMGGAFIKTLIVLALVCVSACDEDACVNVTPSMEVDVEIIATSSSADVTELRVVVDAAGLHKEERLSASALASGKRSSIHVIVGDAGRSGFVADIMAEALDANGIVLAKASEHFEGSGDGCNRVSLALRAESNIPEGGVDLPPDQCGPKNCAGCCTSSTSCVGGVADDACGSGGTECVNCSTKGAQCQDKTCTQCEPECNNKDCGEGDGCGSTCEPGSGCTQPPDCVAKADADTLLLYTFEGTDAYSVTDITGDHGGLISGSPARVTGKATCGKAMAFPETEPISAIIVPDSSVWDLDQGSVDFWVFFDTASDGATDMGLASRDANGSNTPGHLSIARACNGSIAVRIQNGASTWSRCSEPVNHSAWHHVGVNFGAGGLELFVDGQQTTRTTSIECATTWVCGGSGNTGISGNNNPWTVGAASWRSDERSPNPLDAPLQGKIDSFRISSVRRSF